MVRKLVSAAAAALISSAAFAQGVMHDTWDINAPNGAAAMMPGQPLTAYAAPVKAAAAPMHDTWDINAPNGLPAAEALSTAKPAQGDTPVHGHASASAAPDRTIEVGPGTRHVNVTSGETVLFKVGDRSFTWTFDATLDHPSFELSQIAPEGLAVQRVRIYCAPDPYERAS